MTDVMNVIQQRPWTAASGMETALTYRHRTVNRDDVAFIRKLIAENPDASRLALSKKLCMAWNWVQPNGALRDMVCRGLMLALHRAGEIELPAARSVSHNHLTRRVRPGRVEIDQTPVCGTLSELGQVEFRQVRRSGDERFFNSLIETHHYLGYTRPVGEHLKFLVRAQGRPLACFAWSSAPRHLGARDRYIEWSAEARLRNIRFVAYNTRFLILPWVNVPHLASHLLGRMTRMLSEEWMRVYRHPVYFAETFVDPLRFRGTRRSRTTRQTGCIWAERRAAARTTGRQRSGRTGRSKTCWDMR